MCNVVANQTPLIASHFANVHFNQFPLRWGHLLVITKAHVTTWCELSTQVHDDAQRLVLDVAQRLERRLGAKRIYVAALGTTQTDLPMTSPHLHWHVVPLFDQGERPSDVLTWEHGDYEGTDEEWSWLAQRLRA
jgi:diadenosine tetraphosphate (Ap4A) HIT family hydrolase